MHRTRLRGAKKQVDEETLALYGALMRDPSTAPATRIKAAIALRAAFGLPCVAPRWRAPLEHKQRVTATAERLGIERGPDQTQEEWLERQAILAAAAGAAAEGD